MTAPAAGRRSHLPRFVPFALGAVLLALGCAPPPPPGTVAPGREVPPPPAREFRGAWIATVANIDWPSEPGQSPARQRRELVAMLDRARELNLNAVVLQVRTAGDALYASTLEPWSAYLTGRMGRAPEPSYDPLAFAVEAAHERGLELHAWFNPYRAHHPSMDSPVSPDHISRTRPELVREYGEYLWMDPGEPAVQDHTVDVILDVVRRYDIDGVHLDDYFYPYPSYADGADFPDERSWTRYVGSGGQLDREDWRRQNVDVLIERLYREIKAEKVWVKFGISPFGIWRPGHPEQIVGFDPYRQLYADARKWIARGWVDYIAPQLYWRISAPGQSFPVLLDWWARQNAEGRHLWPGGIPSSVRSGRDEGGWPPDEISGQVFVTRGHPGASGNILFSMRSLMGDENELVRELSAGPYADPALVPASPWLAEDPPGSPRIAFNQPEGGPVVLRLRLEGGEAPWLWVLRFRYGEAWTTVILPGGERSWPLRSVLPRLGPDAMTASAVDRVGNEGPRALAVAR